jgi:hypothetical protein
MNYLFIVNDGPYGNERPYNALRLAMNMARREGTKVRVFLVGDGVQCAVKGQDTPQGYYNDSHPAGRRSSNLRDVSESPRSRAGTPDGKDSAREHGSPRRLDPGGR